MPTGILDRLVRREGCCARGRWCRCMHFHGCPCTLAPTVAVHACGYLGPYYLSFAGGLHTPFMQPACTRVCETPLHNVCNTVTAHACPYGQWPLLLTHDAQPCSWHDVNLEPMLYASIRALGLRHALAPAIICGHLRVYLLLQGALRKGIKIASIVLHKLGPVLPFPGEQAANLLLSLLDMADQVHTCACMEGGRGASLHASPTRMYAGPRRRCRLASRNAAVQRA